MQAQCSVLGYRIDLYFNDYKLAIEIDEKENIVRNVDYDKKQQNKNLAVSLLELILIKKPLILKGINEMFRRIKQSSNQLTKKTSIDKISLRLT